MNLTEEEILTRVDTGFVRFLFVAVYWFEQFGSITSETPEQCMLFHINSFITAFYT